MPLNVTDDLLEIYQWTDFFEDYFLQTSQSEIVSIIADNPTTIQTSEPHNLATGGTVIVANVQNTQILGGVYTATVLNNTTFTVPVNTTNTLPVGGLAIQPTNITNWEFAGQIRSTFYTDPGTPNLVASAIANSSEILIEGESSLEEGDEITIAGAGVVDIPILGIFKEENPPIAQNQRAVLILASPATTTVRRAKITRSSKLVATLDCDIVNPLAGNMRVSLPQSVTKLLTPAPRGTDGAYVFDIKYKSGGFVSAFLKGNVIVYPTATQVDL